MEPPFPLGTDGFPVPPYNPPQPLPENDSHFIVTITSLGMSENLDAVLTQTQTDYLEWLCTAPSERTPPTKVKFADMVGVDSKTLRRWEKKPVFRDEWERRVNQIQGSPERTQRLLDTLYAKALDGDTKSAQLYLQATNRMAPQTLEIKSDKSAAQLSDTELDELIAAMASREKQARLKVV